MNSWSRFAYLFILMLIISGCSGGPIGAKRWAQFHADGPSQGFTGVHSTVALSPKWTLDINAVAHSSPVLAADGTIYVGTLSGQLLAINPDGSPKCSANFPNGVILSSPAVGADENIYIVTTREINSTLNSAVHSVNSSCQINWGRSFPFITAGLAGRTTASPKTWSPEGSRKILIFVPVKTSRRRLGPDNDDVEDGLNELWVFDGSGNVVAHKSIGGCIRLSGGGSDIGPTLRDIWDFLSSISIGGTGVLGSGPSLYEIFGGTNSTVAIVNYPNIVRDELPLIVVADNCLGLRLTGFKLQSYDPFVEITRQWTFDDKSDFQNFTSPAVFGSGLVVLGREDGLVLGLDVTTGNKLWEYDANELLIGTPASFGRQIYLSALSHLQVIDFNGAPVIDKSSPLAILQGQTIASPALSVDYVYVSTSKGIHSRSFDLLERSIDAIPAGLSSPAVAPDGTLYVVTLNDDGLSSLHAYPGR